MLDYTKTKMAFGLSNRTTTVLLLVILSYLLWIYLEDYTIRPYASFIPLLFALQVFLSDMIEFYIIKRMTFGSEWFTLFIAPGTILHELSHFIVAFFSGCYITGLSLFKPNPRTGMLGCVSYRTPMDKWSVLREYAIAFAPFFGCGTLMVLINYILGGDLAYVVDSIGFDVPDQFIDAFIMTASSLISSLLSMDYTDFFSYILLYLQMCFALGAAPSSYDFKGSFEMIYKNPLSTLFTLLFLWLMLFLSEEQLLIGGLEWYIAEGIQGFFRFVVTILLASSTLLILLFPIAFIFSSFGELLQDKKRSTRRKS